MAFIFDDGATPSGATSFACPKCGATVPLKTKAGGCLGIILLCVAGAGMVAGAKLFL